MTKEQRFLAVLRDLFIGAPVQGRSGYISLMRIKASYFSRAVLPLLQKDISDLLSRHPSFRDELFEKLYDFFNKYFSASGSVYYHSTPFNVNIYEKVYSDEKDVSLFWKTHMLHYVKSDRLFRDMDVELDGMTFRFGTDMLEHKQSNERRALSYDIARVSGPGTLDLSVSYSERGKRTDPIDLAKSARLKGRSVPPETLERALRLFEKQSEVDYFINKDARGFLETQFSMWMHQYIYSGETQWSRERIEQLQGLKKVTLSIIAFISQFENELLKVWNKPKFVLGSHFVISLLTLKKLVDPKAYKQLASAAIKNLKKDARYRADVFEMLGEVYKRPLEKIYVKECTLKGESIALAYAKALNPKELKRRPKHKRIRILDQGRERSEQFESFYRADLVSEVGLNRIYIDTRYFDEAFTSSLLREITRKHDLERVLDGRLIRSENYQALNTMLTRFREQIHLIYIDPPFNTQGSSYAFHDKFRDSTWITLLNERLRIAKEYLTPNGSIYVHLSDDCSHYGRILLSDIFGSDPRREITWNTSESPSGFKTRAANWIRQHDTLLYYAKCLPSRNICRILS